MTTMASNVATNLKKLSHKAFRALLKKFRRKKKRQLLAQERERREKLEQEKRENSPNFQEKEEKRRRASNLWDEYLEREKVRKHKEWLNREAIAQYEFKKKKLLREHDMAKKEEERKKMLAELEEQNAIAVDQANRTRDEKAKKEEALQAALLGLPEVNGPWHNPIAPENYTTEPEVLRNECHFFMKTGCCRFGDMCSRGHNYPSISCTLLIKGMYSHFSIGQSSRDDYDTDMGLEFEDRDTYSHFKEFYEDVLPEFKTCGNVVQFKVCCNHEPHLRGNVYVQFSREEEAMNAYKTFNGRFYAGKQLTCEFTSVNKWRSAICGLFTSNRCPKGNNCNFLHVFRNPTAEFRAADRDLPARPNGRSRSHHHNDSPQSSRSDRQRSSYSRTETSSRTRDEFYSRQERSERHSSRSKKSRYYTDSDGYEDEERSYSRNTEDRYQSRSDRHSRRSRSISSDSQSERESRGSSKSKKKKKKHRKSKKKKRRSGSRDDVNEVV